MRASYRDPASAASRSKRGTGSLRERSPGVWEVRVVVGFDPRRSRSIQRSFTVRGDAALAARARRDLVAPNRARRAPTSVMRRRRSRWGAAGGLSRQRSAMEAGHAYLAPARRIDPGRRPVVPPSSAVPDACGDARRDLPLARRGRVGAEGVGSLAHTGAVSWAVAEGLLRLNPLAVGPGRPGPHHRTRPVGWRPWPDQVGQDPAGDPRDRDGGHDPAPLPDLGGPR
jgi:hypothetical protein